MEATEHSPISGWYRFSWVLGFAWQSQSLWPTECHAGAYFTRACAEWTLDNFRLDLLGLQQSGGCLLVFGSQCSFCGWLLDGFRFAGHFASGFRCGSLLGHWFLHLQLSSGSLCLWFGRACGSFGRWLLGGIGLLLVDGLLCSGTLLVSWLGGLLGCRCLLSITCWTFGGCRWFLVCGLLVCRFLICGLLVTGRFLFSWFFLSCWLFGDWFFILFLG